ncbi:hypothetical protein [Granulicella tundricola]|uniref:Uncharacterized protein n=1 Tax=Granulicella tundricola (strain ATCC BAA-1859 / DSM 23138 / MP5ACTX9) TaxID=1198114 RepID=E8X1A9_GRATM|nr:hypothetical protein [Granulicella tundricola]ADW69063.1 hypothetical protein AciX9_2018 [Granulicella tundricola MP5ACTX9]
MEIITISGSGIVESIPINGPFTCNQPLYGQAGYGSVFLDVTQTYIPSSMIQAITPAGTTITPPTGAAYVHLLLYDQGNGAGATPNDLNSFMMAAGTTQLAYVDFNFATTDLLASVGNNSVTEALQLVRDFGMQQLNLFNVDTVQVGALKYGVLDTTVGNFRTSALFPVFGSTQMISNTQFPGSGPANGYGAAFFDFTKTYIPN